MNTMSRHTAPSIEFEKLKLAEPVNSPSQRRGLTGKSSSSSHRRRTAASHASSSLTGSHSSRTTSTSAVRPSAEHSGRQLRPSTRSQPVNDGDSDGIDDGERGEESNSDENDDSDDPDDRILAIRSYSFCVGELMACGTDNNLTSVQIIPSTNDAPAELSTLTYVKHPQYPNPIAN
jgi:hypothetical protein